MKSRPPRQPLNLTDPEPEVAPSAVSDPGDMAARAGSDPERPLSERRRRRMAEEARLAQDRLSLEVPKAAEAQTEAAPLAVAAGGAPVASEPAPPPAPIPARRPPQNAGQSAYVVAGLATLLWIGGVAAYLAYEVGAGAVELEPLRLAVYAMIALAPAGLALMLAQAVRQGARLATETRRARELSEALVAPTALAAQQTGEVLQSLRADIDHAAIAAERARNDMTLLREALTQETQRLNEAAEAASRTARRLQESLGQERAAMADLGQRLDVQATGVVDAVERQSRMVADASDLAQTQLREAEAALAARAADLAAAAAEAQDAARLAADDLARQTLRLENAGSGVAEQIQSVEEGLGQQRAALVTAAYALRTDQEDFSAQVESQRAQLVEQLSASRAASSDLGQTSVAATESIKDMIEAATDQFRALVEMSQREADGFDNATKVALDRFETLAAEARDALLEETRRALEALEATAAQSRLAADEAAHQAQIRADRLGEALFDAAQKADQAADTHIDGARRIAVETAELVDQAGERAVSRLETAADRLQILLDTVDRSMTELDRRAAELPEQARERVDAVRAAVEEGLQALTVASRKAAEDTEALDASFQDRVRRNYEMLTEAVRLMGVVSGDTPVARRREPPPPSAEAEPEPLRPAPRPPEPPRAEPEGRAGLRGAFGLRNRLRLEPAQSPPAETGGGPLDWSDLVEGGAEEPPLDLDTPVSAADFESLSERVTQSIRRMGVDPNALLPRARVEEAAAALTDRDADRARQIVRRVAPAAVRSVSRRVLSDAGLRADAEAYVRGFSALLGDYARAGDAESLLNRLASDGGRAFMLLDAAVGDLA